MNNNRIAGRIAYGSVILFFLLILFNIRSHIIRTQENLRRNFEELEEILLTKSVDQQEIGIVQPLRDPPLVPEPQKLDSESILSNGSTRIYLTSNFHGIVAGGGLGNQLFELMSLIGMAHSTGRIPWFRPQISELSTVLHQSIAPRFPRILKQFEFYMDTQEDRVVPFALNYACCVYTNVSSLQIYSDVKFIAVEGAYFQSFKYFNDIRPLVRSLLLPSKLVQLRATNLLPGRNRRDFKICVHIRRGDFISDGLHVPTDPEFTKNAAAFLVEKYNTDYSKNISVIVMGNDQVWGNLLFMDLLGANRTAPNLNLFVLPTSEPEMDLAFTRIYCDVTLITAPSSTFAFWLSYLAKDGAVSYYRDIKETNDQVINEMVPEDFYPPDWIKLRTNSNGEIYEN